MKITQALLGEHGAIYPLLDLIEAQAPSSGLDVIKIQAAFLQSMLVSHAGIEDVLLRPMIQEHLPAPVRNADGTAPPTDHEVIEGGLRAVLDADERGKARRVLLETVAKTRKHFKKEERVIFRIAERELPEDVQDRLGAEWAARRSVVLAV